MTLYIKNMVCNRCILVVKTEMERMGLAVESVKLGEVQLAGEIGDELKSQLDAKLRTLGFELLEDRKSRIVETVKNCIVAWVRDGVNVPEGSLSHHLSERLRLDYRYLSTLFSETQGRTIENYLIAQKIERVKELLVYDELTLSEIAFRTGYSSVAHLSAQFKRVTGSTTSQYKRMRDRTRRTLDEV